MELLIMQNFPSFTYFLSLISKYSPFHLTDRCGRVVNTALRIPEAPSSNLGSETGYSDRDFSSFSQPVQANARIAYLKMRPRPLPFKSFPIHHSRITLSFDSSFNYWKASLNKLYTVYSLKAKQGYTVRYIWKTDNGYSIFTNFYSSPPPPP
jgi:hypothetical protein